MTKGGIYNIDTFNRHMIVRICKFSVAIMSCIIVIRRFSVIAQPYNSKNVRMYTFLTCKKNVLTIFIYYVF